MNSKSDSKRNSKSNIKLRATKKIDSNSDSKSNSEVTTTKNCKSEGVLLNFVQRSEISTFACKKNKARSSNIAEGSDDVSAFTQAIQGTYETRMVKFET